MRTYVNFEKEPKNMSEHVTNSLSNMQINGSAEICFVLKFDVLILSKFLTQIKKICAHDKLNF